MIPDPKHSDEEERFILLGQSIYANLLVVCHCYRASETVIRIISARKASKKESQLTVVVGWLSFVISALQIDSDYCKDSIFICSFL